MFTFRGSDRGTGLGIGRANGCGLAKTLGGVLWSDLVSLSLRTNLPAGFIAGGLFNVC
jgi:hypothetical protein